MISEEFKIEGLRQKQMLPLEGKIILTQERIREWYDHWEGKVYVSFSGGKDSTALKHLVETTSGVHDVPNVFVNTGLEYPEIQRFVKECKGNGDNVEIIRPKMRFDEVIKTYGYPVFSKDTALYIYYGRKALADGNEQLAQGYLYGTWVNKKTGETYQFKKLSKKALDFALNTDIPTHNKCCYIMKKNPS